MSVDKAHQLAVLRVAATPGPWRALRQGNAPLVDGTLVGQSSILALPRPYQPSWVGYSTPAAARERHHTTMLRDEDADFIVAAARAAYGVVLLAPLLDKLTETYPKLTVLEKELADVWHYCRITGVVV